MASTLGTKSWGAGKEFWGLDWVYDPQWLLDDEQRQIQAKLIEICRTVIRPNAVSITRFFRSAKRNLNKMGHDTSRRHLVFLHTSPFVSIETDWLALAKVADTI